MRIILFQTVFWIAQVSSNTTIHNDPSIDRGAQHLVFLGAALLSLVLVVIIGIFSSRTEHAIIAAVVLSLVLIGMFFVFGY